MKKFAFKKLSCLAPFLMAGSMALTACFSLTPPHERNEIYSRLNAKPEDIKVHQFDYDYSVLPYSLFGTTVKSTPTLFEIAYEGDVDMDSKGMLVNNSYAKWKYRMILASEVHVTKKDGTVAIYTNDDTDGEVVDATRNWFKQKTSTDAKSINNPKFLVDLKDAQKVQITFKDNIYWANHDGTKTKHKITPEDAWFQYARVLMTSSSFRYANGSSDKIDKLATEKYKDMSSTSERFNPNSTYGNEYLIKLFNVNAEKLTKKETFLSSIGYKQALTLEADKSKNSTSPSTNKADFDEFFKKILINSSYFSAVPSDFIKENNAKNNIDGLSGLAAETGYYWYGAEYKDMLWAGPYILTRADNKQTVWKQNASYYDEEWVKSSNAVRSYVEEYDGSDKEVFRTNSFESYKNNQLFSLDWNLLTQEQQAQILDKPTEFNLKYYKGVDNRTFRNYGWSSGVYIKSAKDLKFHYNEAAALLIYGQKQADLTTNTKQLNDHYWTSESLVFRSLVSNAFNLYGYQQKINPDYDLWLSLARPAAQIAGKDEKTSSMKTLKDNEVAQNSLFALKTDKSKFATKTYEQEKSYNGTNASNDALASQSSTFQQLKTEMKSLLDNFFISGKGKDLNEKQIDIQLYNRFLSADSRYSTATTSAIAAINALDSRLKFTIHELTDDTFRDIVNNKSLMGLSGWNYDYDGYGGFLGYVFYMFPNPVFSALVPFADLNQDNNLAKAFPEIVKLAKAYKADSSLYPTGARTFNELKTATATDWGKDVTAYLKKDATNFEPDVEYARFAFSYQKKTSNEDLAKLNAEFTSLLGINPMSPFLSTLTRPLPTLQSKYYVAAPQFTAENFKYVKIVK